MIAKPTITETSVVNAVVVSWLDVVLVTALSEVLEVRRGVRTVLDSEVSVSVLEMVDTLAPVVGAVTVSVNAG